MANKKNVLTVSALIFFLIVVIARVGQKTIWVENHVRESSRGHVKTTPPEIEEHTESEGLAKQRIRASLYIKNASLLTQTEIDELKALSAIERRQLLSYYRAFLDPNTPDLKPLKIESHNGTVSIETLDEFDYWMSETF